MSGLCSDDVFVFSVICFSLLFHNTLSSYTQTECNKSKCLGPIKFYEDLGCAPIYKNRGDCCAIRYDCSHLYKRSIDKCYANGTEYAIGDTIKNEDNLNPCSIGCVCNKYDKEVAKFTCSVIDCFFHKIRPGCYFRRIFNTCCVTDELCPEKHEDIPKCLVDGKIYSEGDIFHPNTETKLVCQCLAGYEGNNVLPYCRKTTCGTEEHNPSKIYDKCAPLYSTGLSLVYSCTSQFRCQKENDTIINTKDTSIITTDEFFCEFGEMKLRIGEELDQSNTFTSSCVKCKCEVPPTLSCQRLKLQECNAKFSPKN